jgi:hypothetical protein
MRQQRRCGRAERAACRTERPESRREFTRCHMGTSTKARSPVLCAPCPCMLPFPQSPLRCRHFPAPSAPRLPDGLRRSVGGRVRGRGVDRSNRCRATLEEPRAGIWLAAAGGVTQLVTQEADHPLAPVPGFASFPHFFPSLTSICRRMFISFSRRRSPAIVSARQFDKAVPAVAQ